MGSSLVSWRSVLSLILSLITTLLRISAVLLTLVAFLATAGVLPEFSGATVLSPLNSFVAAVIAILVSIGTSKVAANTPDSLIATKSKRNRVALLKAVRADWVDGLFEHSLHNSVPLELGMKSAPTAVEPKKILRLPVNLSRFGRHVSVTQRPLLPV
jgi:hypothetical protein